MDIESDAHPTPEPLLTEASGVGGLTLFMTQLIEDPSNYNANGEILISRTTISLIRVLVQTEKNQCQADKRRDAQMKTMADQINKLIRMQPSGPPANPTILQNSIP